MLLSSNFGRIAHALHTRNIDALRSSDAGNPHILAKLHEAVHTSAEWDRLLAETRRAHALRQSAARTGRSEFTPSSPASAAASADRRARLARALSLTIGR